MKKILVIATAILVFILLLIFALNSLSKKQNVPEETLITPTTAPFNSIGNSVVENEAITPIEIVPEVVDIAKSISPYETETFLYEYYPQLDKIVVTEKTPEGQVDYEQWIVENGLPELAIPNELVVFEKVDGTGPINEFNDGYNPMVEFLNVFFKFGQGSPVLTTPTPSPVQSQPSSNNNRPNNPTPPSGSNSSTAKMTYYAQCNGYGNIPLPSGCTVCEAGCGPTTVAMIAASYLGSEYNPKTIVDLYDEKGYYLSCAGSRYTDAKAALEGLGLKTTSYLTYNFERADQVANDFKKYIDAGWTIFTLANYCDKGCGHYFWVTDVEDGKILAYDPFYGKSSTPPYNENARYPFPKYRLAFGVKK
jgi:hypothetical protein